MNYELNPSQRDAVICCDSPSLVIAGAGSGKTRVLTYKIAYLLQQGMKPYNILALTFTNKAAREMKERISLQVGQDCAQQLWMGTFHSIFSRILRYESAALGFDSNFTIYDATDAKSLIKNIIKTMGLDDKKYKPGAVASHISMAKNQLILPSQYAQSSGLRQRDELQQMPMLYQIYQTYWERCRQAGAMDFDDLLVYTWILFSQYPDVLARYVDRFHFVLVDEYQDTNYAQDQIVWLLTQSRQKVCVVGDDAQSIYSFRGANIDNILRFQQRYTGARLFKLEQNYRSTQTIVSAANSLIHHNRGQIHKEVFSQKQMGEPISLIQTYSDVDEANSVVRCVRQFRNNEQIPYNQIAILYRTNAQSRSFEEAMRKAGIPYRIFGGLSFYQRKEIKDIIAYLRLAVNPRDEESLRRVINYPARGIGQTTVDKIFTAALRHNISPWDVLHNPDTLDVNNGTKAKLRDFTTMIQDFHQLQQSATASQIAIQIVGRTGIQAEINHGTEPDDKARQENMQELIDGISAFVMEHQEQGLPHALTDYLQEVSLISDLDQSEGAEQDRVTLMTIHSAKGLEFRVVFVVGMEEELFPSSMSSDSPRGLEEERRLFYVAMTRAMDYLILTHAKSRFRYGKTEFAQPSRFLKEIDPRFVRVRGSQPPAVDSRNFRPISQHPTPNTQHLTPIPLNRGTEGVSQHPTPLPLNRGTEGVSLTVGTRIQHDRFGLGTVTQVSGAGMDAKATVQFDNVGTKQLLLRFAKFVVVK